MPIRLLVFKTRLLRKTSLTNFWLILCLAFGAGMICFPAIVFATAKRGLQTWWNIVLPSLLPFFIISELLMNLGFVSLLGRILEPVMKPLFNLPGSSGFILGVSYLSGSPLCSILTARLWKEGLCTKEEGERLIAFTSNASPLFMLGAVSVGMLGEPSLGTFIASIHYASNLLCGFFLKFLTHTKTYNKTNTNKESNNIPFRNTLKNRFHQTGLSFGSLLGETVRNATTTLLTIGGFIALFSVLVGIMQATGIFSFVFRLLAPLAKLVNIDTVLLRSLLYGFFEMTIGINEASKSSASLLQQLLIIEAILAWNGLSIHAQVAGMIAGTDLSIIPYLFARLLQVPLAVLLTYSLFPLLPEKHIPAATLPLASELWHNATLTLGTVSLLLVLSFLFILLSKSILEYCRHKKYIIH